MDEEQGVALEALSRRYGAFEAVRALDLRITAGEIFGMLGPNGAGKTTTLSMLATLLAPSAGDARLFGRSLSQEPGEVRRLVGLVPQEISLYPDLTAEENLRFFGRLNGVPRSELAPRVDELLALVSLTSRRGDRVRSYSGGMKRRLNLACSLMHRPRLLLLDEPTVGVDPQSRESLFDAVRRLASEGTTILYTTHYMEEAETLCDRIAILDEGRVVAVGTLDELLDIVGTGEVVELRGQLERIDTGRLAGLPEVIEVQELEGLIRVFVKDAARALGPLGGVLAEAGDAVARVDVHPIELKRVFLHLTGKELRD